MTFHKLIRPSVGPIILMNRLIRIAVGADYVHEHSDPGNRRGDSPVMLSTFATLSVNSAKHLAAHRDRPFASLRVTVEVPIYRAFKCFLAIGWFVLLVLLLTACSSRDVPAVATDQTVHIPLGTTLLTPQSASSVFTVVWSPDGKHLASGSWDTTAQVWDATTGHLVFTYRGHSDIVGALAWPPDGNRIASVDDQLRV